MKILTVYSRRVDVVLYILQIMIFQIQGNVITFLRTLWIWHWHSFGQHWTFVGAPWTTHSPLHRARSGHRQQEWEEGGTDCDHRSPVESLLSNRWTCQEAIHLFLGKAENKF